MIITLRRDAHQPVATGTLGILEVEFRKFHTMELPWLADDNGGIAGEPSRSRIPAGLYRMERRHTEARGHHWLLHNTSLGVYKYPNDIPRGVVGGRSLVLIHAANWAHELRGCIAPGRARVFKDGEWMVTDSRAAMTDIRNLLGSRLDLQLMILDPGEGEDTWTQKQSDGSLG